MARFYFGQILLAYVRDGEGHTKEHPVIIIDSDEGCASGAPIQVVVISTKVKDPCPHFHLRVHDTSEFDPRTGLYEPCVVKCNWCQEVEHRRIIKPMGSIPDDMLDLIINKINELLDDDNFTDWVDRE